MSVLSRAILLKKLENKEYRDAYVTEHVKSGIAFQIRALRKKKSLSQEQLAAAIETKQAVVSRLENPDYGYININTLYKIASAFDVALLVKFVPYTKLLNETKDLSPEALAVDDFISENNALNSYKSRRLQQEYVCKTIKRTYKRPPKISRKKKTYGNRH